MRRNKNVPVHLRPIGALVCLIMFISFDTRCDSQQIVTADRGRRKKKLIRKSATARAGKRREKTPRRPVSTLARPFSHHWTVLSLWLSSWCVVQWENILQGGNKHRHLVSLLCHSSLVVFIWLHIPAYLIKARDFSLSLILWIILSDWLLDWSSKVCWFASHGEIHNGGKCWFVI